MSYPISSIVLFHGLVSAFLMLFLSHRHIVIQKVTALLLASVGIGVVCWVCQAYEPGQAFQFVERVSWIPSMGVYYHVGMDGVSLSLVVLTFAVVFLCVLSICSMEQTGVASACGLIFFVQAMTIGAFLALDGLLFYLFWEASLLPMFLYIGLCGGKNRWHAARKYFLFTIFGSLFFLMSILYLGLAAGDFSFQAFYQLPLGLFEQQALFIAFFMAFAIKLPMFPLHNWLPDAHTQASTAGSMLLAAILLKLGGYGFLRFNLPITPDAAAQFSPWMVGLSLVAIIYIGFVAIAQTDIKRLIAYASISHMGMITLGLFVIYLMPSTVSDSMRVAALTGAVVHMIGHGLSSAGLFLGFGLIYHRIGSRDIAHYGGLMRIMPALSGFFMLCILSNIGFPGTAGFVGEFMIIFATCSARFWIAACAVLTMVLSAAYSLGMVKGVFYGRVTNTTLLTVMDIGFHDKLIMSLLAIMIITIGIYPSIIMSTVEQPLTAIVQLAMHHKI